MSNRRGEPIETERGDKGAATSATPIGQSVEDILRPLAEWRIPCTHHLGESCECEDGQLDPRFEALRRRMTDAEWVTLTWPDVRDPSRVEYVSRQWIIDTSLGAIVRAAAACGLGTITFWYHNDCWHVRLGDMCSWDAATPEEALARALVAAVGDEKAQFTTAPGDGKS